MILKELINPSEARPDLDAEGKPKRLENGEVQMIPAGAEVTLGRFSVKPGETIVVPPHIAEDFARRWKFLKLGADIEVKNERAEETAKSEEEEKLDEASSTDSESGEEEEREEDEQPKRKGRK